MTDRYEHRAMYIDGWYELNEAKLWRSTHESFVFEDPAEPAPVTRDGLADYMRRWDRWTRARGATNSWKLSHEVRQDSDGVLTDWERWQLVGTDIQGMAFVITGDDGVLIEKITYFDRDQKPR